MREIDAQDQQALILEVAAILAEWAPGATAHEIQLWARYLLRTLQLDYQAAGQPYGAVRAGLLRWLRETVHEKQC